MTNILRPLSVTPQIKRIVPKLKEYSTLSYWYSGAIDTFAKEKFYQKMLLSYLADIDDET